MRGFLEIGRETPAGFFSNFFWAVAGMQVAESQNLVPIINFRRATFVSPRRRAWLSDKSSSTENIWDEYFLKHDDFAALQQAGADTVELSPKNHPDPDVYESDISDLRELFFRCSGLQPRVIDMNNAHILELQLERPTLGVHLRSTDMHTAPGHPTPPSVKIVGDRIHLLIREMGYRQVFIASDSSSTLNKLTKRLRRDEATREVSILVLSNSTTRSEGLNEILQTESGRVLADTLLLAQCDSFIHSKSNVAFAAQFFKGKGFAHRVEIDCGVNPKSYISALIVGSMRRLFGFSQNPKFSVHTAAGEPPRS